MTKGHNSLVLRPQVFTPIITATRKQLECYQEDQKKRKKKVNGIQLVLSKLFVAMSWSWSRSRYSFKKRFYLVLLFYWMTGLVQDADDDKWR